MGSESLKEASSGRSSRSAVKNRVPTKLLAGVGSRRTSEEVKTANKAASAAAAASREKARREDAHRKKVATRPDLHEKTDTDMSGAGANPKVNKTKSSATKLKIVIRPQTSSTGTSTSANKQAAGAALSEANSEVYTPSHSLSAQKPVPVIDPGNVGSPSSSAGAGNDNFNVTHTNSDQANPEGPNVDSEDDLADGSCVDEEEDHDREDDPDYNQAEQPTGSEDDGEEESAESDSGSLNGATCAHYLLVSRLVLTPLAGWFYGCAFQPQTKADKGLEYREQVSASRQTSSSSAISKATHGELLKRKVSDTDTEPPKASSKRPKHEEPGGLLKGFRKTLKQKKAAGVGASKRHQSTDTEGDEYNGGMFDDDKDEVVVKQARENVRKGSTRGSKPETTVRIIEHPTSLALPIGLTRRQFKKTQCKKSNLPFPGAHANRCRELWDQRVKASLIAWNATLRQPFSSSTILSNEVRRGR
ncbi:hypothetical protein MD484_g9056, partial [Candolleomyces efflorescens]